MTTIDNSLWEQFLLSPMYYIYWGIALISSLVFTIQTIMLFVGFDTDADFSGGDVAFDVDGLALVSVKTVACFLLGFGWSGVILAPLFENAWVVALISLGIGALFMFGAWILLKQVLTLSQDNTFHADKIVGYTADVTKVHSTNSRLSMLVQRKFPPVPKCTSWKLSTMPPCAWSMPKTTYSNRCEN